MKWPTPALGQIATITGGSTPNRSQAEYWNGSIPWLTPTDLPMPGKGIADVSDTAGKITGEGLAAISAQLLPVGTVLFSSRATIGKLGISRVPLVTNQGFANFIPKKFVDAKYLAYCLLHYTAEITTLAGSTTFKELTKTALKKYKIPLPALSEQLRIVEIIDQADALRKKRAEADAKAARILPALFYKMFGDPATNPKGWPIAGFGTVAGKDGLITDGDWILSENMDSKGTVRLLQLADIGIGVFLDKSKKFITESKFIELKCTEVKARDVLISRMADPIGRACIVPELPCRLITAVDVSIIRPDESVAIPEYLVTLCNTSFFLERCTLSASGTTRGRITRRNLEKILIPIPPIVRQRLFAQLVRDMSSVISKKKQLGEKLECLFNSLLHRAFAGDLTAKWREAHMKELLQEMEQQAQALKVTNHTKNMKGETLLKSIPDFSVAKQ